MTETRLRELLQAAPIPAAGDAQDRGLRVAMAAFEARPSRARPRPKGWLIALAAALLLLALGLSPAGAKVADLIKQVINPGAENARPALTSLPAPGQLLATTGSGAWVIHADGSKRRLGAYRDATWSPSGLFVAVTRGSSLTAVEPDGTVRWSLSRQGPVSDPAWAPSGIRIAYLEGRSLRVVAGDGTGDRMLRRHVSSTPPAWAPNPRENALAFVDRNGVVRLVDVETGVELWQTPPYQGPVTSLSWSADGRRLLVMTPTFFTVYDAGGRALYKGPTGGTARAAALSPDGRRIAIVRGSLGTSELVLVGTRPGEPAERKLYSGAGRFGDVEWSPDGTQLLLTWPSADQWLFVRPADRHVVAIANISAEFAPGASAAAPFPRPAGWCCGSSP